MTDGEPENLNGQSCQQLRYYQIRGEKWLLKLKLKILAVLCVLLGAFLIAFKVQDVSASISHKETICQFEGISICDTNMIYSIIEKNLSDEARQLQAEKRSLTDELHWTKDNLTEKEKNYTETLKQKQNDISEKNEIIKQLQTEKTNLSSDVTVKEETIKQLQTENDQLTKDLQEKEKIIQQLRTEKNKPTCYPQSRDPSHACCAKDWKYFSGKCYYFSTDEKTWTESRDACVDAGGDLVIISSIEKQEFLKRSYPGGGEQHYWVGLTDAVKEGDWRWLDGTRLSTTPKIWNENEPDNWTGDKNQYPDGEDCALMQLNTGYYGLQDSFCEKSQEKKVKRVCEAKAVK